MSLSIRGFFFSKDLLFFLRKKKIQKKIQKSNFCFYVLSRWDTKGFLAKMFFGEVKRKKLFFSKTAVNPLRKKIPLIGKKNL